MVIFPCAGDIASSNILDLLQLQNKIVGIDWNRIARLHSHVLAHMNSLTASQGSK